MGVVYEAVQLSLNRLVALKVLPPGTTPEQRDIERFQREAQAAASLDHPNIVPIYAQGDEEGIHYYAMKLVQGRSLNEVVRETREKWEASQAAGRFTTLSQKYFRTAGRLIMEVAEALEYAHSEGVIHRDIKPHNLMLTPEGHLVVTDFGLARFLSAPSITISGEMMGTPAYMSPEQVRAEQQRIDRRTDIYSLGITLYEMLALEVPFRADTREALLRQILMKDPPPLRRINPRIPKDLETICHKAIEKDSGRRYQSAKLFAHDLRCFLEGFPITARPIGPLGRVYRRALRRKALTAAFAGVLLALMVGTYFAVQAHQARQSEMEARRREQVERQAKEAEAQAKRQAERLAEQERLRAEAEATAKLEKERASLLAQAQVAQASGSYPWAKQHVLDAARIRWCPAVHLCLWQLARQYWDTPVSSLAAGEGQLESLALSPDGTVVAAGSVSGVVKVWEVAAHRQVQTLTAHTHLVKSLAFSPGAKVLASAGFDGAVVRLWDWQSGAEIRELTGHESGCVLAVAFSPDGMLLASGGEDNKVKLWDGATGEPVWTQHVHTRGVASVAFSPDGKTLASGSGANSPVIKLWEVASGRELASLAGHTAGVHSLAFSPDGRLLASGSEVGDSSIRLWDVARRQELRTLSGHTDRVSCLAFSPDGAVLASGADDRTLTLWEVGSGRRARVLRSSGDVTGLAFSPDGSKLLVASRAGNVETWSAAVNEDLRIVEGRPPASDAASADDRSAGGGEVPLEEVGGARLAALITEKVSYPVLSPDRTLLAARLSGQGPDTIHVFNTVKVWDASTGEERVTLSGHRSWVTSIAFGLGSAVLATASHDGTVKLWDVTSGQEILTLSVFGGHVRAVAFADDGRSLVCGVGDDSYIFDLHAYDEQIERWLREAGVQADLPSTGSGPELAEGSSK